MTLPPVVRVFFAIALPHPIKEEIGSFIGIIKKQLKYKTIRWTKVDNLHITLQFLAETKSEDLPNIIQHVRLEVAGKIKKIDLSLGDLTFFPHPSRPRVIVIKALPQESLAHLSAQIGQGIANSGYTIETRPYRAHLTLGRIKQPEELKIRDLSHFKIPLLDKIEVREIVLYRSEPHVLGSVYTVIEKIGFSV